MKNVLFKRAAIIIIAAVVMSVSAVAQQQGDKAIGGNMVLSTWSSGGHSYSYVGFGPKFFYNVTDPIRLVGEFDYFLKKDNVSRWDLSVYGHYLFAASKVVVYPSVGLGMLGWKMDQLVGGPKTTLSGSDFAFSFGGGADYEVSSNLFLSTELRLKLVNNTNRLNIAVGLAYKF